MCCRQVASRKADMRRRLRHVRCSPACIVTVLYVAAQADDAQNLGRRSKLSSVIGTLKEPSTTVMKVRGSGG